MPTMSGAARPTLTAIAVVAASQSVARSVAVAARGVVAATIAEAALLAAFLTAKSRRTGLSAKALAATNTRCMTLGAICLAVPLAMTFLAPGMAMTAIRRAVMEATASVVAVAGSIAIAAEAARATAARAAAVAARTIRRRSAGAQFVFRFQPFDGMHLDVLLSVALDALQQLRVTV